MKAVVFLEPNGFVVEERPVPAIGDADVLVKVHACGICGTDIHILHGKHFVKYPVVPGHEFSGEVVEVGNDVTTVRPGDRVTVDPNIVCHSCFFCRRGQVHLCEKLTATGVNFDGGFAEYCRVPAVQVYPVPEAVSLEEAAMAEPLACCIHGVDRADIVPGNSVVVLGAGSIGLLLVQLARIAGARQIIVSEPDEKKRKLALQFGADMAIDPTKQDVVSEVMRLTRVGADNVIESAGRLETAEIAVKLARRGGSVLQFGVVSPDLLARISPNEVYFKELTIRGSFVNPFTHSRAVDLLASGQVQVAPILTHRFPLDRASEGFETMQRGDAVKVLLVPE